MGFSPPARSPGAPAAWSPRRAAAANAWGLQRWEYHGDSMGRPWEDHGISLDFMVKVTKCCKSKMSGKIHCVSICPTDALFCWIRGCHTGPKNLGVRLRIHLLYPNKQLLLNIWYCIVHLWYSDYHYPII